MNSKVCWHCGSGLPDDVKNIPFSTATERRIFGVLLNRMGTVVPYSDLWPNNNSLQAGVVSLRKALEGSPYSIENVYRRGYVLHRNSEELRRA